MSRVQQFIDQGARPRFDGDDALQLRIGRRFVRLSAPDGALNTAGNEYEARTGETLPASGFQNQKAIRKGNTETIRLRSGKRGMTRRWNATSNRWDFTNLGKKYYQRLRRNWVVQVPVTIHGLRKDRSTYEIKGVVPVAKMGITAPSLPLDADTPTRNRRAKQLVLDQIPADGDDL